MVSPVPVPGPPIAQETVMDVVGDVGTDVGGQPCHEIPRQLTELATGMDGHAQLIAREETAHVDLVVGC